MMSDETLDWLLSFEKLAGVPVTISVLVENGRMVFKSCSRSSEDAEEVDTESDQVDMKSILKKTRPSFSTSIKKETSYIS